MSSLKKSPHWRRMGWVLIRIKATGVRLPIAIGKATGVEGKTGKLSA
jgi:hypothetical protein